VLGWVAQLGVSGMEPMRWALGLSQSALYSHVSRLVDAGLLARVVVGDGAGGAVALTPRGARVAQARGFDGVVRPWVSAPSTGRHARAVSWLAASAQLRGWRWLGPAQLRADGGWMHTSRGHAPDLGVVRGGGRTAIEVELHAKSKPRLRAILGGYRELIDAGSLTSVAYVTDRRDVTTLVEREATRALLGQRVHVGPLASVFADVRRHGATLRERRNDRSGGGEDWSPPTYAGHGGDQLTLAATEAGHGR
jgi:hypothetical protein